MTLQVLDCDVLQADELLDAEGGQNGEQQEAEGAGGEVAGDVREAVPRAAQTARGQGK